MASTELRKRKLEEYEMQLFGFHSRAVYATLKSIVYERIHYKIEKLCETLAKTYKLDAESLITLKANQKQLEKAYCKEAKPHLKSIENIVNKYISIPSNVLLDEDRYQRTQYTDSEFENIKQNLEDLQERAKRATILNAALKEELEIIELFPVSEDNVNEVCKAVENGLKCPDVSDKMYQLVEGYKQFSTNLFGVISVTEKSKYNTIENLKCKDFDLNSL